MVDIISPGTVNIARNLGNLVESSWKAGLTGLAALTVILYLFVLRPLMVLSAVYAAGGINRDMISRVERQTGFGRRFAQSRASTASAAASVPTGGTSSQAMSAVT